MTTETVTRYAVQFDRIGRTHDLTLKCEATDADALAEAVYRFAQGKLGSKSFEVVVNLEAMTGSIEYGRFGTFTIAVR